MTEFNINDRIILDYDSLCDDIENILNEVNALRLEKLFKKALGDDFSEKVKESCGSVKKRLYGSFNIVIIGDFKRGKSTLINAIIGEDIAPTAVTPETVTFNKISFSETVGAEAVLKNGKRVALSYNELNRKAIEHITEQLPSEIDFIDIKSNAEILRNISVIDTPGVGDLLKEFDQKVADYLVNADALLYVISARSPLSITEQAFLSSAVLPHSFSRIFAVVNMADTLETVGNVERITELTKERITAISPDISTFILSALDEICRKKDLKRPEPELADLLEMNFLEFESALQNDIILQKDIIKSSRAVSLAERLFSELRSRVNLIQNSLKANSDKLLANEEEFKNQNSELLKTVEKKKSEIALEIDAMKNESKGWLHHFLMRLKQELESIGTAVSVSDMERHFQFFMSDLIKSAVTLCVERHQKDISEKLTNFSNDISQEITQSAFGSVDAQIASSITDISWTKVDTTMFAIDFIGGEILGPLMIVGQTIAGFVRQSTISKKQTEFMAPILQGFGSVINDAVNNIDSIYEQLKLSAIDKLDELFQSQIEVSLEAIEQARQISADEEVKAEQVVEYLNSLLGSVEGFNKIIEKYK